MHTPENSNEQRDLPVRWIAVASSEELRDGNAIERVAEGHLIAIFRQAGDLFAIEALCAHHGGPLSQGTVANGCVTCPWHGWQYRLENGTQVSSGEKLLSTYRVREHQGNIEIGFS